MKILEISQYWWVFVVVALIMLIIFIIFWKLRNKEMDEEVQEKQEVVADDSNIWIIALGGKDNIKKISSSGSRLVVEVKEMKYVDKEKLKTLGVSNIIEMSKKITLVIENKAFEVEERIKKAL